MKIIDILRNDVEVLEKINTYILKADEDLKSEFEEHNIINVKEAVDFTNNLADAVTEIEEEYVTNVIETITEPKNFDLKQGFSVKDILEQKLLDKFLEQIGKESLETQYADVFHDMFSDYFNNTLIDASEKIDKEITITDYSKRTKDWLSSWSHELAEIADISSKEAVEEILNSCKDGKTIEETADLISELGVRSPGYSARRFAITETYRVNNYAEQEAMLQNPACIGKTWDHAGSSKNPRKNHLALDGVTIPVDKPFELRGINGGKYYPMAPHDTCLPAEEVIHCGCRTRPKTSKDILSKSKKEKAKQQQKRIKESDEAWEREFNERNKKASGVDFERVKFNWVKKKSPEEQIKYFGGGHSGKARKALIDSGVITNDEQLNKLYKQNSKGKRVLKTLKELEDDGIMTIRKSTLDHTTKGKFTGLKNPNKSVSISNGGRPDGGFHSESSFKILKNSGTPGTVNETLPNGVRIGNIELHKDKKKRDLNGQTWFPKDWSDDDILIAATSIVNNPANKISDNIYFGNYICHDENVGIKIHTNKPGSIFPDKDNQPSN